LLFVKCLILWLVRSSSERVVRVWALVGDIVLCSWAKHLILTVPLSTQVYKWVPVNCWGKPKKLRGNDLRWTKILSRGCRNTPSRFMLQKPGISCRSYGPLGSKGFINSILLCTDYDILFLLLLVFQCSFLLLRITITYFSSCIDNFEILKKNIWFSMS